MDAEFCFPTLDNDDSDVLRTWLTGLIRELEQQQTQKPNVAELIAEAKARAPKDPSVSKRRQKKKAKEAQVTTFFKCKRCRKEIAARVKWIGKSGETPMYKLVAPKLCRVCEMRIPADDDVEGQLLLADMTPDTEDRLETSFEH